MRHITGVLLALALCASTAQASWTGKVVVWQEERGQRVCQVLFTEATDQRAYILDLDAKVTQDDALKIATARLDDQLAGEAAALLPQPKPIDWQAVALAIVAEVQAKASTVKIDLLKAVTGEPAVTVIPVAEPIEEPIK